MRWKPPRRRCWWRRALRWLDDIEALEALYGAASANSLRKVARRMTPAYRQWIAASRFVVVASVGPEGTDASPRGDDGPVVLELDPGTLAMPDWRGNNRLDTLRNLIGDPRMSLMFMVPGEMSVVRVNGRARITDDAGLVARFEKAGKRPATVIVVEIAEIYAQCAKALMRAGIWGRNEAERVPSLGAILSEMTQGDVDGTAFDAAWPARAQETFW